MNVKLPKYITRIKNKDGSFKPGLYLNWQDPAGKRHRIKLSDGDDPVSIVEAVDVRDRYITKFQKMVDAFAHNPQATVRLSDMLDAYHEYRYGDYDDNAPEKVGSRSNRKRLLSLFPSDPLVTEITNDDVLAIFEKMKADGFADTTVDTYFSRFSAAFRWHSEEHNYSEHCQLNLGRNVFRRKLNLKLNKPRRNITVREIATAADSLPPGTRTAFYACLLSARRKGEIIGLRWDQLELDHDLRCGMARTPIKSVGKTAEEKEWQTWPVSRLLYELIMQQRNEDGTPFHPEMVFTFVPWQHARTETITGNVERKPINRQTIEKNWQRVKKEHGLDGFNWHDLRHTMLTWAGMEGNKFLIRDLGGQRTDSIISHYVHSLPMERARQVDRVHDKMPFLDGLREELGLAKDKPALKVVGGGA
jgi:integrase